MSDYYVREIRRAIDVWAALRGLATPHAEHSDLAKHIYETIEHHYFKKVASKGLLLDVDAKGDYCNARLVDWDGAEETLYPIDPATDEPVEEAVAHFALPLPHVDTIPEI